MKKNLEAKTRRVSFIFKKLLHQKVEIVPIQDYKVDSTVECACPLPEYGIVLVKRIKND